MVSMSGPSLPSDVELSSSCCSLPPEIDESQELLMDDRQVSDSDAETLPESVTDSIDELPPVPSAESDIDMEDCP